MLQKGLRQLLVQLGKNGTHSNPERTFRQEALNKPGEVAPETEIPEVRQNAVLPCCVVSFFKVKENGYDMFLFNEGISNKRFKTNEMIQRTVVLPEAALLLGKKTLRLEGGTT